MLYRRKSTGWKIDLNKKTPKNDLFEWQDISITSFWEDLDDKLLTPGQLQGCFLLPWCITIQTIYWEGLWHQN